MTISIRKSLVTISVIILIAAGYLIYLYGYHIYQHYRYFTHYEDVHGLQRSSPIFVNGVRVGEVSSIELKGRNNVVVSLSIDKEVKLPKGTIAKLASMNLMDEKMIVLELGDSSGIYTHNDFITGIYDTTVLEMRDQISPIFESAKYTLEYSEKNFTKINRDFDAGLNIKLEKDMRSMERDTRNYKEQSRRISESADNILNTFNKLKVQSAVLKAKKDDINASIESGITTTEELSKLPYGEKVASAGKTAKEVDAAVKELDKPGTFTGNLINDDKLYKTATEVVEKAHKKIDEVKKD